MLSQETTIGIYPNGELNDVLIVPDGHEFHLFLTGTHGNPLAASTTANLGSIVIVNNNWIYEGDQLSSQSQREIADYILNYPDEYDDQPSII
ncbi:MAG: hypothetical protein ABIN91_17770 [Mucilaginibacter sp.]|uniref:hypothetical protein n=1 Tax=Mucilaginibacter sp. TaxID=1882438 RepID=UPI0032632914